LSKIDSYFVDALNTPGSETPSEHVLLPYTSLESPRTNSDTSFDRELIENDYEIVYSHDLSGNYTSVSPAAERLIGYSREELLSMNVRQLVDPAMIGLIDQMLSKKVSGEAVQTAYEIGCIGKNGKKVMLEVTSSLTYSNGIPVGVEGIARDITDRKRTEQALRKAKSELQAVFAAMNDVILVLDSEGRCLKIERTNAPRQYRPPRELIGKTLDHILPKKQADHILAAIKKSLAIRESVEFDYNVTVDGKNVWFVGIISPMVEDTVVFVSGDITERKRNEEVLRKSEADFNAAQQIAHVGSWEHLYKHPDGPDEDILRWSDEFFRIFGSEPQAFAPTNDWLYRVIHPDDRELVSRAMSESLEDQVPFEVRHRVIIGNGERRFIHAKGETTFDAETGEPIRAFGTVQDITSQVLADEARYRSEQRFQELVENANDIIYTHDLEGNFTSLNRAGELITGYSREEALTRNIADIVAPEFLEVARHMIALKSDDTRSTVYEIDIFSKSLRRVTLEVSTTLLFHDDVPIGVQGIARDITERKAAEAALRESEKQFRGLFENANDLVCTMDSRGRFVTLNRAGEAILGYTRGEVIDLGLPDIAVPGFQERAVDFCEHALANDRTRDFEIDILTKDLNRVSIEISARRLVKGDQVLGFQCIGRDITHRKLSEQSLRNSNSLLTSTFESTADGIVVLDLAQQIVVYNKKFVEMWQIPQHMLDDRDVPTIRKHITDQMEDPQRWLENIKRLNADPLATAIDLIKGRDGRYVERYSQPQLLQGKPIGRIFAYRDITDRMVAEEKLRYDALHDSLTKLPNRMAFMERLKDAITHARENPLAKFAVLFLDLDRFKVVNDSLGHVSGDKLLIHVAERLKECIRPGDFVARFGGDEFTILLSRARDRDDVVHVAERLQHVLSLAFKLDNYEVFTSASIGIVFADEILREGEDFLRDADVAMYRAKEAGKARYEIFDREIHAGKLSTLQLETDLRRAIERNELDVFYQPIVDLRDGAIYEFEALIRWNHPERGWIGPDRFVGVAEETGLIVPIGGWVLERACKQIVEWQSSYPFPLSVSVNLSAKQLTHPSLIAQVTEILNSTGLAPDRLKLEVTETTVMEDSEKSLRALSELSKMGVLLSTDDFGTGYSSLSYLHRFPFSRLKIDQSFTKTVQDGSKTVSIIKAILLLAEGLGIDVVAEGIETEEHFELLRSLGCYRGQGYYLSKPVKASLAKDAIRKTSETDDSGKILTTEFQASLPLN